MAEEIPFNTAQRTWERAGIIVCGTPEVPYDPSTEIVIAPPPVTSWSRDDASGEQAEPCWGQGPGWPAQCRGAPPLIMGASRFLLDPVLVTDPVMGQVRPQPGQRPQVADGLRRHERAAQHAPFVQLAQPQAVEPVFSELRNPDLMVQMPPQLRGPNGTLKGRRGFR